MDLFPLNITDHSIDGFVEGDLPDALYRAGDGSKVGSKIGQDSRCGTHRQEPEG